MYPEYPFGSIPTLPAGLAPIAVACRNVLVKPLIAVLLMTASLVATPTESRARFEAPSGTDMPYLLFEPDPALMPPGQARPLVVFLHGSEERGDDLDPVKKQGPPSQFMVGDGLPFVLLAPQCPTGVWWNANDVIGLIDKVIKDHNIDPKRVHLTGLSMGGFATWAILAKKPELFASAVPICGGGDPDTVKRFKHIPIWTFHGTADDMVSVDRTKAMDKALRAADAKDFHATYYHGVDHDSWTQTYNNPAVYAWMMQRTR